MKMRGTEIIHLVEPRVKWTIHPVVPRRQTRHFDENARLVLCLAEILTARAATGTNIDP